MISRAVKILAGVATVVALACVDISAPSGPASISLIQLPEFFVVKGDVMRDTLGNPTKPSIIAFDGADKPLTDVNAIFFVTDTTPFAHFGGDGVLAGTAFGTAHILGQVDALQTPSTPIYVTVAPTLLANTTPKDTLFLAGGSIDSSTSVASLALTAQLQGDIVPPATTRPGVGGGIIRYEITHSPPSKGTQPVAILTDNGLLTNVDTGEATGNVSRTLLVDNRQFANSGIVAGSATDSIVVVAHITYKNNPIKATFTIRLKSPFAK